MKFDLQLMSQERWKTPKLSYGIW